VSNPVSKACPGGCQSVLQETAPIATAADPIPVIDHFALLSNHFDPFSKIV